MRTLILSLLFVLAASMVFIPVLSIAFIDEKEPETKIMEGKIELELDPSKNISVSVYRSATQSIENYPLEEYVRGVIAAEMPTDFELEALKSQAIAARTYIVKRMLDNNFSDVPAGAMVSDTVQHQVFLSDDELRKKWGLSYQEKISKLNKAINETSGLVITYQEKPIDALYFSTSNGYTENSEDYWEKEVPYLRSVDSYWDQESPKFNNTKFVSFEELKSTLGLEQTVSTSSGDWIKLVATTEGNRIKSISFGEKVYSGREIRDLLSLNSSSFTWEIKEDGVLFATKGYGHGVGMSQYGANGMAKEGKTTEQIIKYYYTGVELTNIDKWIKANNN